jgi:hypothetical protein
MEINFYNIRDKIFSNSEVQKKLPFFRGIFDQWNLANSIGGMGARLQLLEMELLKNLNSDHLSSLGEFFSSEVTVKKIDNNLCKNYKLEHCGELPQEIKEYREFCVSADKDNVYLTLWR